MANDFYNQLTNLINQHSQENLSNTPDYILAKYVGDCLIAFNYAVNRREVFYGRVQPSVKAPPSEPAKVQEIPDVPIPEVSSAMPVPKPKLPKPPKQP